jgi:transcriptional regulator with XRE-family HTH domain
VQQIAKRFAQRLNKCLDELDMPVATRERAALFGKMLDIPKQQVWSWLEGHTYPTHDELQQIGAELDVDAEWLMKDSEE